MTSEKDDSSTQTIPLVQQATLPHNVQTTPPQQIEALTLTISIIDEVLALLDETIDD